MTDYTELKRLANHAIGLDDSAYTPCQVAFQRAANPHAALALIAELEDQHLQTRSAREVTLETQAAILSLIAERDQLKAENEALRQVMSALVAEIPGAHTSRSGNAPGHCHSIPGVWDRDNGAKAGKECAWCKVWNYAVAMGKGEQP